MPVFEPAAYLRFAAEQIALLREVYYRPDGLAESELRLLLYSVTPNAGPIGQVSRF